MNSNKTRAKIQPRFSDCALCIDWLFCLLFTDKSYTGELFIP